MSYVFDNSPLSVLFKNFYRNRFPSLWERFDTLVAEDQIVSTREAYREIEDSPTESLRAWAAKNRRLFSTPTAAEGAFVTRIYAVRHFQQNIEQQKILKGGRNADVRHRKGRRRRPRCRDDGDAKASRSQNSEYLPALQGQMPISGAIHGKRRLDLLTANRAMSASPLGCERALATQSQIHDDKECIWLAALKLSRPPARRIGDDSSNACSTAGLWNPSAQSRSKG